MDIEWDAVLFLFRQHLIRRILLPDTLQTLVYFIGVIRDKHKLIENESRQVVDITFSNRIR